MDISDVFVKMADCPEIQEQHQPIEGDLCVIKFMGYSTELIIGQTPPRADKKDNRDLLKAGNATWLPRQDQIQEMMGFVDLNHAVSSIYGFYVDRIGKFGDKTWEQLWLAFYMYEKHQKVWSSKEEKWLKKR